MTYFIDTVDKRNNILKDLLNKMSLKTDTFSFQSIEKVEKHDAIIFSPAKKFSIDEIDKLPEDITLYCGNVNSEISNQFISKNITYINLMKDEIFTIKNANLTAEGVLALIIENSPKSMFENNVMILGAGRIAKALSILFSKLSINHSMVRFNEEKFPECFTFCQNCYFGKEFENHLHEYDIIVNTIPQKLFDEQNFGKIQKDTILIETASINCIDEDLTHHFNYIPAPALPQKFSAQTAAKLMLENILGENKYV